MTERIGRGKRGLFYGVLPGDDDTLEKLREDLEDRGGKGQTANNVDVSQRTADDSNDEHEWLIKMLKEQHPWGFHYPGGPTVGPYQHIWGNPESEEKLRRVLMGERKSTAEQAEE